MELAIIILAAYLIGSIPFGLILTKAAGLGDIRQIGSGNIGATNVLRTGNKKLAALTLFLDGFKGFAAIIVAVLMAHSGINFECLETPNCEINREILSLSVYALAGLAAVVGHMYPVWLKFKGGKGVATALGVAFGVCWALGVMVALTWLAMAVLFRYSSLAALVAIGLMPLYQFALDYLDYALRIHGYPHHHYSAVVPLAVIAVLVWVRHHENIKRLLAGTEPKIGQKK